jgi:hypothetical protein
MAKKTRVSKKSKKSRVTRNRRLEKSRFRGGELSIDEINKKIDRILYLQTIKFLDGVDDYKKRSDLITFQINTPNGPLYYYTYLGRMRHYLATKNSYECCIIEQYDSYSENNDLNPRPPVSTYIMYVPKELHEHNPYQWSNIHVGPSYDNIVPYFNKDLVDYYISYYTRSQKHLLSLRKLIGKVAAKTYCTDSSYNIVDSSISGWCDDSIDPIFYRYKKKVRCFGDNLYNNGINLKYLINAKDTAKNYCREIE